MKSLLLASALVSIAGGASAAESSRTAEAVLVAAPSQATEVVVDGRLWRCFGTGCRAQATATPISQSIGRECRRVAAQLGEIAHYRSGKRALSSAEIATCNVGASRRAPATLAGAR